MNGRPGWVVAALLGMIGVLMVAHIALIWVSVRECDEYARIVLDQARRLAETTDTEPVIAAVNDECTNIEETFADVVAQYLAVILALLGGGAAATVISRKPGSSDDPRGDA